MATREVIVYQCDSCGAESVDEQEVAHRHLVIEGEMCAAEWKMVLEAVGPLATSEPPRRRAGKKGRGTAAVSSRAK